jgi:O-antigen/teichoic acid export membrane protein
LITIILGRAAQFLLALAMMRVATTLLSPEEMGRVSLVLTTIAFFALFLVNPVGMFINRRLHAWQAAGVARHYLMHYALYLLVVAFIAIISLPFFYMSGLADFGLSTGWLIILVAGSLIFNTINQTAIPSLNLLGDSGKFVLLSVITIAASFVCATLLIRMVQPSAQYWLLGLLLGQTLLAVVGTKVLFSRLRESGIQQIPVTISGRQLRALFGFAWPVAIAAGLGWAQGQGYRYLMEGELGLAQLGLFVAGYGISAGMIAGFESVLTTYFQPRLYKAASSNSPLIQAQAWQRYAAAVIPSLVLTAAFIAILAPELTRVLLGENFQAAAEYVIWGVLAEAARVLTGIYSLIAHVYMRTRWLILPNIVGAVLALALCALLIPRVGAAGAGMGLVSSGFAMVVTLHVLLAHRAGGGIKLRPVLKAVFAAGGLWWMALSLRYLFPDSGDWAAVVIVLGAIGTAYLWLQYLFLRQHLTEKREM